MGEALEAVTRFWGFFGVRIALPVRRELASQRAFGSRAKFRAPSLGLIVHITGMSTV